MRKPFSVMLAFCTASLLGIASLLCLRVSYYPELRIPRVCVVTEVPGLSGEDVEKFVTVPLENTLSSVKNIKNIFSVSSRGVSVIRLRFAWGADMELIGSDIRNKLDAAYPYLPEIASRPVPVFSEVADSTAMMLAVFPEGGRSVSDISDTVRKELGSRFLGTEGVAQVFFRGLLEKEIVADVSYPGLMAAEGINLADVSEAVAGNVFSCPVGTLENHRYSFDIKGKSDIDSMEKLGQIPLNRECTLRLGDIAEITLRDKEKSSVFKVDGRECLGVELIKGGERGLYGTCREIRRCLDDVSEIYRNIFSVKIIEDRSVPLSGALRELAVSLLTGALSAAGVIILLSGNRKAAFVVILSLPVSLLPVFIFMHFKGITLNIISVSALIIGAGMVFDSSIVVAGNRKAASSVIGSVLTTVLIFIPVLLIPGIIGSVFEELALTVIVFLGISCVTALFFSDTCFRILKVGEENGLRCRWVGEVYRRYLDYASERKKLCAVLSVVFLVPLFLFPAVKKELIPRTAERDLYAAVCFPGSFSFGEYCRRAEALEKELLAAGASVTLYGGREEDILSDAFEYGAPYCFSFGIRNISEEQALRIFSGKDFDFRLGSGEGFLENLMGSRDEKLMLAAGRVSEEYHVSVSELSPYEVFMNMALGTEGEKGGELEIDGVKTDIRIRYGRQYVDSVEKVASLMLKNGEKPVFTAPYLKIGKKNTKDVFIRKNRKSVSGTENEEPFSAGDLQETLLLFTGALILVWLALAFQFESLTDGLKILASVPVGIGGSFLFLLLSGNSLNIGSLLGIMIMSGTAVNSGILILEDMKRGLSLKEAACRRAETAVLTVVSTLLALLPVAFTAGNPLIGASSVSLAGGLLWGTLAIFILIPLFAGEVKNES